LAEAEKTAGNLFIALARMSLEAGKTIERALILTEQLKKVSLSLVIIREKEAIIAPKSECTICHFTILKARDKSI
jgi:hypothetical protein